MKDQFNKYAGAILGSLTLAMALGFAARFAVSPKAPKTPGYMIEVPKEGAPSAESAPEKPIAVLLAEADPEKGARAAKQCTSCHSLVKGGPIAVGPPLYGVVGRKTASFDGYAYSAAMLEKAKSLETWSFDALNEFLKNPKAYVKGTKMAFAGLSDPSQRANVIAYINTLSDAPLTIPTP